MPSTQEIMPIRIPIEVDTSKALPQITDVQEGVDKLQIAIDTLRNSNQESIIPGFVRDIDEQLSITSENIGHLMSARQKIDYSTNDQERAQLTKNFQAMYNRAIRSVNDIQKSIQASADLGAMVTEDVRGMFTDALRPAAVALKNSFNAQAAALSKSSGNQIRDTITKSFFGSPEFHGIASQYGLYDQGKGFSEAAMSKYLEAIYSTAVSKLYDARYVDWMGNTKGRPETVKERLPQAFRGLSLAPNPQRSKINANTEKLTKDEQKTIEDYLLAHPYVAREAEDAGLVMRYNGRIYSNPNATRSHVNAFAGNIGMMFESGIRGGPSSGISSIEKMEDLTERQRRSVLMKSNLNTANAERTAQFLAGSFSWLDPFYAESERRKATAQSVGNWRNLGKVTGNPRQDAMEFYEVSLGDIANGKINIPKWDDKTPYNERPFIRVNRSLMQNMLSKQQGADPFVHNGLNRNEIYVKLPIDMLSDYESTPEEINAVRQQMMAVMSAQALQAAGLGDYTFGGFTNTHMVLTKKSLKDQIEANKETEDFLTNGATKSTFKSYEDFSRAMDYRRKLRTEGESVEDLWGTDLSDFKVVVADLKGITKNDGQSIASDKYFPYSFQGRAFRSKGTNATMTMDEFRRLYGTAVATEDMPELGVSKGETYSRIADRDIPEEGIHKGDLVFPAGGINGGRLIIPEGTGLIEDLSTIKTKDWITPETSQEEANRKRTEEILRYGMLAKTTSEGFNTDVSYISSQEASTLELTSEAKEYFRKIGLQKLAELDDPDAMKRILFSGDDYLSQLIKEDETFLSSPMAQDRKEEYRRTIASLMRGGALLMPQGTGQYAMLQSWIPNIFNALIPEEALTDEQRKAALPSVLDPNGSVQDVVAYFGKKESDMLELFRNPSTAGGNILAKNAAVDSYFDDLANGLGLDRTALYADPASEILKLMQTADEDGDTVAVSALTSLRKAVQGTTFGQVMLPTLAATAERFKKIKELSGLTDADMQQRVAVHSQKLFEDAEGKTYGANNPEDIANWFIYGLQRAPKMGLSNTISLASRQRELSGLTARAIRDVQEHYDAVSNSGVKENKKWNPTQEEWDIAAEGSPFFQLFNWAEKSSKTVRNDETGQLEHQFDRDLFNRRQVQKLNFASVHDPHAVLADVENFLAAQLYPDKADDRFDWDAILNDFYAQNPIDENTAVGKYQAALKKLQISKAKGEFLGFSDKTVSNLRNLATNAYKEISDQVNSDTSFTGNKEAEINNRFRSMGGEVARHLEEYGITESRLNQDEGLRNEIYKALTEAGYKDIADAYAPETMVPETLTSWEQGKKAAEEAVERARQEVEAAKQRQLEQQQKAAKPQKKTNLSGKKAYKAALESGDPVNWMAENLGLTEAEAQKRFDSWENNAKYEDVRSAYQAKQAAKPQQTQIVQAPAQTVQAQNVVVTTQSTVPPISTPQPSTSLRAPLKHSQMNFGPRANVPEPSEEVKQAQAKLAAAEAEVEVYNKDYSSLIADIERITTSSDELAQSLRSSKRKKESKLQGRSNAELYFAQNFARVTGQIREIESTIFSKEADAYSGTSEVAQSQINHLKQTARDLKKDLYLDFFDYADLQAKETVDSIHELYDNTANKPSSQQKTIDAQLDKIKELEAIREIEANKRDEETGYYPLGQNYSDSAMIDDSTSFGDRRLESLGNVSQSIQKAKAELEQLKAFYTTENELSFSESLDALASKIDPSIVKNSPEVRSKRRLQELDAARKKLEQHYQEKLFSEDAYQKNLAEIERLEGLASVDSIRQQDYDRDQLRNLQANTQANQLIRRNQSLTRNAFMNPRSFTSRILNQQDQNIAAWENQKLSLESALYNEKQRIKTINKDADPTAYADAAANIAKLEAASSSAGSQLENMSGAMGFSVAAAQQLGTAISNVAQRLGRQLFHKALQETKRFVQEYNKSMTTIQMITLKSDSDMSKLGSSLIDRAQELKISVGEITQSAETLYRQGLSDQEVEDRLGVISKFSKVSGTKVEDATKLITVAMNTGLVDNAQIAADIVTALGDNAATNAAQIEKGIEKAGAAAAADGTTFGELAAMLTAITSTTQIGGNVAGRTLNTIIGRMNKIGTNELIYDENGNAVSGSAVAKLLSAQGISMYDEGGNKRSTFDTLYALAQKWESMSDAEQQQMANAIAGTRQYSNFSAIMQGMAEGDIDRYMSLVGESSGITDQKFEIYTKSLEASLINVRNAFDELIADLTDNGALTGFLDGIASAIQGVDNLATSFGGLGAAIVPVLALLASVAAIKIGAATGNFAMMGVGAAAALGIGAGLAVAGNTKTPYQSYVESQNNYKENVRSQYSDIDKLKTLRNNTSRTAEENKEYASLINKYATIFGMTDDAAGSAQYSIESLSSSLNSLSDAANQAADNVIKEADEQEKAALASQIRSSRAASIESADQLLQENLVKAGQTNTGIDNPYLNGNLWYYDEKNGYVLRDDADTRLKTLVSDAQSNDALFGIAGWLSERIDGKKRAYFEGGLKTPIATMFANASSAGMMGDEERTTSIEAWGNRLANGIVTKEQIEAAFKYASAGANGITAGDTLNDQAQNIFKQLYSDILADAGYNGDQIAFLAKRYGTVYEENKDFTKAYDFIFGENATSYEQIKKNIDNNLVGYTAPVTPIQRLGLEDAGAGGYYIDENGLRYSPRQAMEAVNRYNKLVEQRERDAGFASTEGMHTIDFDRSYWEATYTHPESGQEYTAIGKTEEEARRALLANEELASYFAEQAAAAEERNAIKAEKLESTVKENPFAVFDNIGNLLRLAKSYDDALHVAEEDRRIFDENGKNYGRGSQGIQHYKDYIQQIREDEENYEYYVGGELVGRGAQGKAAAQGYEGQWMFKDAKGEYAIFDDYQEAVEALASDRETLNAAIESEYAFMLRTMNAQPGQVDADALRRTAEGKFAWEKSNLSGDVVEATRREFVGDVPELADNLSTAVIRPIEEIASRLTEFIPELKPEQVLSAWDQLSQATQTALINVAETGEYSAEFIAQVTEEINAVKPQLKAVTNYFQSGIATGVSAWETKNSFGLTSDKMLRMISDNNITDVQSLFNYVNENNIREWSTLNTDEGFAHLMDQYKFNNKGELIGGPTSIESLITYMRSKSVDYGKETLSDHELGIRAQEALDLWKNGAFISQNALDQEYSSRYNAAREQFVKNVDQQVAAMNFTATEPREAYRRYLLSQGAGNLATFDLYKNANGYYKETALDENQRQYIESILGTQLTNDLFDKKYGGLSIEQQTLVDTLMGNAVYGVKGLTAANKQKGIRDVQAAISSGNLRGYDEYVANQYMAGFSDWGTYRMLKEQQEAGTISDENLELLDKYQAAYDNFVQNSEIEFKVTGLSELEQAGKLLEGTVNFIKELDKGGKFAIEAELKLNSELVDQAQLDAMLNSGNDNLIDQAVQKITGVSGAQYYNNRQDYIAQARRIRGYARLTTADSLLEDYNAAVDAGRGEEFLKSLKGTGWSIADVYGQEGKKQFIYRPEDYQFNNPYLGAEKQYTDAELYRMRQQILSGEMGTTNEGYEAAFTSGGKEWQEYQRLLANYRTYEANAETTYRQEAAAAEIKTGDERVEALKKAHQKYTQTMKELNDDVQAARERMIQEEGLTEEQVTDMEKLENLRLKSGTVGGMFAYSQEQYRQNNKGAIAANEIYKSLAGANVESVQGLMDVLGDPKNKGNWKDLLESSPELTKKLKDIGLTMDENGNWDASGLIDSSNSAASALEALRSAAAAASEEYNKRQEVLSTGETYERARDYMNGLAVDEEAGFAAFSEIVGNSDFAQQVRNNLYAQTSEIGATASQAIIDQNGAFVSRYNPETDYTDYFNAHPDYRLSDQAYLFDQYGMIKRDEFGNAITYDALAGMSDFSRQYGQTLFDNMAIGQAGLTDMQRYEGLQQLYDAVQTGGVGALYRNDTVGAYNDYVSNSQYANDYFKAQMLLENYNDKHETAFNMENLDGYADQAAKINEALQTLGMTYQQAQELAKLFHGELAETGSSAMTKYTKASDVLPSILGKIAKGGKDAKEGAEQVKDIAKTYSDQMLAIEKLKKKAAKNKKAKGKSLDNDTLDFLSSIMPQFSKDDLKKKTLGELENLFSDAGKDIQQEAEALYQGLWDSLKLDEMETVDLSELVDINADGKIDSTDICQQLAGQLSAVQEAVLAVMESFEGEFARAEIDAEQLAAGIIDAIIKVEVNPTSGYKGGGGGGGGGGGSEKSPAQKLLDEHKHQVTEATHYVTMATLHQEHYDFVNDYDAYEAALDEEADAYENLSALYKKQISELQSMLSACEAYSDDWWDVKEAIDEAQESLLEIQNALDEIETKRVNIIISKQEEEDKPGTHKQNLWSEKARKYDINGQFESYAVAERHRIAEYDDQMSLNDQQIAELEKKLESLTEGSDAWIAARDEIWAIREENAQLANDKQEALNQLDVATVNQFQTDLENRLTPREHDINMASSYAQLYQSNRQYGDYRTMLAAQNARNQENIGLYQDTIDKMTEEMSTLTEGSEAWYAARDAIFSYEEAILSATLSIDENNRAIEQSRIDELTKQYTDANDAFSHTLNMLKTQQDRFDKNNNFIAYQQAVSEETELTRNHLAELEDQLAGYMSLLDSTTMDTDEWDNLTKAIRDTEESIESTKNQLEDLERLDDEKLFEHVKEMFTRENNVNEHNIKMTQYYESLYQNRGELTNYGVMLQYENEQRAESIASMQEYLDWLNAQLETIDKTSDLYYEYEEEIQHIEEQMQSETNAIEKNNEALEKNQEAILKVHNALISTIDKEIKTRVKEERDMLSAEVSIQNQILNVIRKRYQQEWQLVKQDIATKKQALQEEKALINERLNARLNADKMQDRAEQLAELQRQLALISSDPTRTRDVLELQKQIEDLQREISDQVAQDEAKAATARIDDEVKALTEFEQYNEKKLNEMLKDANSTQLAEELEAVMGDTNTPWEDRFEKYMEWIRANDETYKYGTEEMRMQMELQNQDSWKKMVGFVDTYWEKVEEIIDGGIDSVLDYMRESRSWRDASDVGRALLEYGWTNAYDDYESAYLYNPMDIHNHTLEDQYQGEIVDINSGVDELIGLTKDLYDLYEAMVKWDYIRPTDVDPDADTIDYRDYAGVGKKEVKVAGQTFVVTGHIANEKTGSTGKKYTYEIKDPSGNIVTKELTASSLKEAQEKLLKELQKISEENKKNYRGQLLTPGNVSWREETSNRTTIRKPNARQSPREGAAVGNTVVATLYKEGGLVDYTGPAYVHGSPTRPEAFLDAEDTQNMRLLLDAFKYVTNPSMVSWNDDWFNGNTTNVGDIVINITQAELNTDMDIEDVARKIGKAFTKQLSREGINLNGYSW